MTSVIYARYSSDNQREESIEGQIRECTDYAEKNGITVIKHYIDRAFSAKTDNRPEFQQMIKDSGKKLFDVVLVWKFDRFARNRFDSANYKMILKKNGVHLISVMEPIAEGSQGILVETLLEGMAEYYSAELSEKVIRGQTENALKGKCTGGTGTIGYKIDEDKFYHLDPLTAPLVLEAFQRYDNGDKMVEIVNFLNDKGVRNMLGGKMTHSSVNTMLKNRRYIGELSFRDIVVPDAIPVIVPKDLFDRVQKRLDKNKRAPACGKADEEYLLTTKLFCGKCGALMFGESGTSATGRTYYYYKCANVKRRKGCNKKTVQKDWLEDLVVRETMKLIQDDAVIDKIVQLVMDVQNQENTTIPLLEKQLREVNKKLDNLMKAIEDGLYTRTTKERLEALEIQKDELTAKIADEKLKKPSFNEDFIRFWLMKFRRFDISQKKQRKALIEIFVNAIFLYDDRMLLTFNYKDGTQTVRLEDTLTADSAEEKSSDLSSSAGLKQDRRFQKRSSVLIFYSAVSGALSRRGGHCCKEGESMNAALRRDADVILRSSLNAVLPDEAVRRALRDLRPGKGRVLLVAAGKAAWQMAHAAVRVLGRVDGGVVVTKYGHVKGEIPGVACYEAGHPVPDANGFAATQKALELVQGLTAGDTVLFLLSGGGSALFEQPLVPGAELQDITSQLLASGADIVEMNTIRKRLSGVKGGRFAQRCAPAQVFGIVLSDILGDPLDMIASGPAVPDTSTCAQALAVAEKYHLALSAQAWALLAQETPKTLDNVATRITGSVRELCRAAASACRNLGYEPVLLTDQLCCEAREAGSFLGSIVRTQAGQGKKLAYIAGGETIVHLTGKGLGGRNQELALAAAPAIAGLNAAVFSVGSDGTDGPTDAAGGYVDGDTLAALEAGGWSGYAALQNNDSYHALKAVDGLIITGATGTNVNDVAVALIGEKTPPVSPEVSPEW